MPKQTPFNRVIEIIASCNTAEQLVVAHRVAQQFAATYPYRTRLHQHLEIALIVVRLRIVGTATHTGVAL